MTTPGASPYIGITGIACARDARDTLPLCVSLAPPGYQLMAGVLVSAKTLRGEAPSRRRYPERDQVEPLLAMCEAAGAWPVIHYNSRSAGLALLHELQRLRDNFPSVRGVQLNMRWPTGDVVSAFRRSREGVDVVMQINRATMRLDATDRVESWRVIGPPALYRDDAAYAIIDLSSGGGVALDLDLVREVLAAWDDLMPLPVVAGGLDGESVRTLRGLACDLPVSCDAESGLRTPDDDLDPDATVAYVRAAAAALAG